MLTAIWNKVFNLAGCILVAIVYAYLLKYSGKPLTFDTLVTIFLAELCRWTNQRRRYTSTARLEAASALDIVEKGEKTVSPGMIAAVVGYREDPILFKQALESYLQAQDCRFLLVSIDGDTDEDEEMIDVFREV